jgi:hypothetical protein
MEGPNRELKDTAEVVDEDFRPLCLGNAEVDRRDSSGRINELTKIVFSGHWRRSNGITPPGQRECREGVSRLKHQTGHDLALFGGADLASTRLDR